MTGREKKIRAKKRMCHVACFLDFFPLSFALEKKVEVSCPLHPHERVMLLICLNSSPPLSISLSLSFSKKQNKKRSILPPSLQKKVFSLCFFFV